MERRQITTGRDKSEVTTADTSKETVQFGTEPEALRLDQESFTDLCERVDRDLAYEMRDRSADPNNPSTPSHADRMEHLIETHRTPAMEDYLAFVTSAELPEDQPALNDAEKSILNAIAAQGMLRDADNYRIAHDETGQEALHEKARKYLTEAGSSLLAYQYHHDDSPIARDKINQIHQFLSQISYELETSNLRNDRLRTEAAQAREEEAAWQADIDDDLRLAGRPPRQTPDVQAVEQSTERHLRSVA